MKASFPKRRSDLNFGIVDGETVVLDRKGNFIHQLNQTATCVWERCDGKTSGAELALQLTEAFDVNPKAAAEDVAAIVLQFRKLNLLEPTSSDGTPGP